MNPESSPLNLSDRELLTVRVLTAPRQKVFEAWKNPELLKQWWGPEGFSNIFEKFEFHPQGEWLFVMRGPDGKDYKNHIVYLEVTEPERIVLDHTSGPEFQVTAIFEELNGKTQLSFHTLFKSAEQCQKIKSMALEGNQQMLDKLERLLSGAQNHAPS